jgi:hypothetical protein
LCGCSEQNADALQPVALVAQTSIPPLEVVVAERDEPEEEPAREAPPPVPEPPETVESPPAMPAPPVTPAPAAAPAHSRPVQPTPEPKRIEKPAAARYEPPFPDRVDLFVAPKREGGAAATPGTTDTAVELLGFVRLADLKAILSINGEVAPMKVGESRHGVEIISITPPNIVLQRGRQRWQASLE